MNLPLLVNTSMPISSEERSEVEVDTTSSACHAAGSSASTANEKGAHHRPKIIHSKTLDQRQIKRKKGGEKRERARKKERERERKRKKRK